MQKAGGKKKEDYYAKISAKKIGEKSIKGTNS